MTSAFRWETDNLFLTSFLWTLNPSRRCLRLILSDRIMRFIIWASSCQGSVSSKSFHRGFLFSNLTPLLDLWLSHSASLYWIVLLARYTPVSFLQRQYHKFQSIANSIVDQSHQTTSRLAKSLASYCEQVFITGLASMPSDKCSDFRLQVCKRHRQ